MHTAFANSAGATSEAEIVGKAGEAAKSMRGGQARQ
jgi:hypothetical protein